MGLVKGQALKNPILAYLRMTTRVERGEWDSKPWAILGESKVLTPQIIRFGKKNKSRIRVTQISQESAGIPLV